jgi:hypothetical protein
MKEHKMILRSVSAWFARENLISGTFRISHASRDWNGNGILFLSCGQTDEPRLFTRLNDVWEMAFRNAHLIDFEILPGRG